MASQRDIEYMRMAFREATNSPDPYTQVGATLVLPKDRIVLSAHNRPTYNRDWQSVTRYDKNLCFEHAERCVLYEAASRGFSTLGATIYSTWFPCRECYRALELTGISRLVSFWETYELRPMGWTDTDWDMFSASKIQRELIEKAKMGITIRFDGRSTTF